MVVSDYLILKNIMKKLVKVIASTVDEFIDE